MIRLLPVLCLLCIYSCGKTGTPSESVYFAGEIVNPTSDYVVLFKDNTVIDSVKLDGENHFAFNLPDTRAGLYHFDHRPELQYLYLEKGDSIIIRLNTDDFDESLVFSGRGSDINNFLVEMFLAFENERSEIYGFYALDPEEFSSKIDSMYQQKMNLLNELVEENTLSDNALKMAKSSIDYNTYIFKEKYPFYHKKRTGEAEVHLSENFYAYRQSIDLNDSDLAYFKPYYDFMLYHLGNVTYMTCKKNCGAMGMAHHKGDLLHFNKHKLKLVDSLIKKQELRDVLFRNVAMNYLLKEHRTDEESNKFIDEFSRLSQNKAHIAEIIDLYKGIQLLQPNNKLPKIKVKDTSGTTTTLPEIADNRKTIFYFWTGVQKMHFRKVTNRVKHLEQKYPELAFVGVNIRTSESQWRQLLNTSGLNQAHQYRTDNFSELQRALIIDELDKCVIAKDSVVIDGFANLFTSFKGVSENAMAKR